MTESNIRVSINQEDFSFGKRIYIGYRTPEGYEVLLSDGKTITVKDGSSVKIPPTLVLNEYEFQALVDAIHKDYKPSEGKFTEGKLVATEKHLEDMRKLVFDPEIFYGHDRQEINIGVSSSKEKL